MCMYTFLLWLIFCQVNIVTDKRQNSKAKIIELFSHYAILDTILSMQSLTIPLNT